MTIFSFGDFSDELGYKVLDERVMRGASGVLLFVAIIASINGFILKNFSVIPYFTGAIMLNFFIGVFINPKFSLAYIISKLIVGKQSPLLIGAIQKRFAWSLGFSMVTVTFILSILLQGNPNLFGPVCMLCIICIALLYLESAFGVCVGCKLYFLAIKLKLLKEPKIRPNCSGDSCKID